MHHVRSRPHDGLLPDHRSTSMPDDETCDGAESWERRFATRPALDIRFSHVNGGGVGLFGSASENHWPVAGDSDIIFRLIVLFFCHATIRGSIVRSYLGPRNCGMAR